MLRKEDLKEVKEVVVLLNNILKGPHTELFEGTFHVQGALLTKCGNLITKLTYIAERRN